MSWFPTGTELAYRICVNNTAPRPIYVYHSSGLFSVIPGHERFTGEEYGGAKFTFSFKTPNARADKLFTPANEDSVPLASDKIQILFDRAQAWSKNYGNTNLVPITEEVDFQIKYADDQFNKVYLIRSLGIVCSYNKERLLERLGNEGYVLSAPLQNDPEVVEYTQSPSAINRVFYKDSVGRFSSLWTTMSGQAVSIPNQREFEGADGLYSTVIIDGEQVSYEVVRFGDFETMPDILKKLTELDVHPSQHDAVQCRSSKVIQTQLDAVEKTITELDKTKEELRKSKLEIEELKRLRVRDKEAMDDLRSDSKKNTLLDWLKATMGWFGIEIKRFFLGKLLFI